MPGMASYWQLAKTVLRYVYRELAFRMVYASGAFPEEKRA